MKVFNKIEQGIESVNEWGGRIGWFLILYMMSFGLYDVIMRYLFNMPSLWIWLALQFAMVMLACVAGGYAFLHGDFVKLDILYGRFSPRGKAIADTLTFMFTLLYCAILIWKGIEAANMSFSIRQMTPTAIRLPLYPLKALIPLGAFLLLLVAGKKFISDIQTVIHKGTGQTGGETTDFLNFR